MIPNLWNGALCLCLALCVGCSTVPVVMACPPIPAALTVPCQAPARPIETNGDLALAYVEARACLREESLKLAAVRELADCRVKP